MKCGCGIRGASELMGYCRVTDDEGGARDAQDAEQQQFQPCLFTQQVIDEIDIVARVGYPLESLFIVIAPVYPEIFFRNVFYTCLDNQKIVLIVFDDQNACWQVGQHTANV